MSDLLMLLPAASCSLLEYKYFKRLDMPESCARLGISVGLYHKLCESVLKDAVLLATQRGLVRPVKSKRR